LGPSQIALVERLLGEEIRALGYTLSGRTGISFDSNEERSFKKAEQYYREMVSGEIRRRFRRQGLRKLRAYKIFGRALDLVPSWRVATTDRQWLSLAEEPPARKHHNQVPDPR